MADYKKTWHEEHTDAEEQSKLGEHKRPDWPIICCAILRAYGLKLTII